jgi:hypothetical protein
MAPVTVELKTRPPAEQEEVVFIEDFDRFAEAQTGLACGDDVPYR